MPSTTITEISRLDLDDAGTTVASISDVKHLSSYNWIEASTPTIAVPGSPPRWSAPEAPQQLKKDSGLIYIAQNAARHPESPLEPLFRALYITDPSYDIRSVDVVSDRNNIRKLLSFINPGLTKNELQPFTINVEVTKDTAIFCRMETATYEFIRPHQFRGFGHEFEKAYTTNQVSGSTGHHRIISYRFGDLQFVVRHETDGYVDSGSSAASFNTSDSTYDHLPSMLESLSLSPINSASTGSKLNIKKEGQVVPLESTLEIKTRVVHRPLKIREVAPQLWVSQTPKLVRAYHKNGIFQTPEVEDVTAEIKRWEEVHQKDLRKLAILINKIIIVVKGCGGTATVKYDEKRDKLVVWKVEGKKFLPAELYSKWNDGADSEEENKDDHDAGAESVKEVVDEAKPKRKASRGKH